VGRSVLFFCILFLHQIDHLVKKKRLRLLALFWQSCGVKYKLFKAVAFWADLNATFVEKFGKMRGWRIHVDHYAQYPPTSASAGDTNFRVEKLSMQ